jgi:DNA processing protein
MPFPTPSDPFTVEQLLGRALNDVEAKNAPPRLFAAGNTELLRQAPRVSIVGSRKASRAGLENATKLSAWLSERGITVVSGLAEGIDTAAHTAAIRSGGQTVAVLGTPLDKVYPEKNRALQLRIARDYLALSQFSPGTPSQPSNFPRRNRTMALLSDATVIVEAAEKSGSLHQGWEALRLGRPLYILSNAYEDASLTWPKEFVRYGAEVLSVGEWEGIFEQIPESFSDTIAELAL